MKVTRKQLIALILIASTVLLGLAAVYIGIKLGEEPDITPQEIEAWIYYPNTKIKYSTNCFGKEDQVQVYLDPTKETICLKIKNPLWSEISFVDKHWCDTDQWLSTGCNCPLSEECDKYHEMADGSYYQQGLYTPTSAQCSCLKYDDNNQEVYPRVDCTDCTSIGENQGCACELNVFGGNPYPSELVVCLDRVKDNRSKTYCGLQQIDISTPNAESFCYLSGLMDEVPECEEEITTPTPSPVTCGEVCTQDDQCTSDLSDEEDQLYPGVIEYTCDESLVDPEINNQCVQTTCPEGQILDTSTEWPCDCILTSTSTPTPTLTLTTTPTLTLTITSTITPTITRTPTLTPSLSPSLSGSPSPTPPTITTTELPPTALVSNEVDIIIIGLVMIFTGIYIYRSGAYVSLGQLYWDKAGKQLNGNIGNITNEIEDRTEIITSWIKKMDKSITGTFSYILNTSIFIYKYIKILLSNIKDKIILTFLKLIQKINNNKEISFEDKVISKQKNKDGQNE